jgi:enoyl-CoA hydratase/carnithine racemase
VKSKQSSVLVEQVAPGVQLLTLNLPAVRNAMTQELTARWTEVMEEIRQDRSVRVAVLTGAGTSFCSGADLSWLDEGSRHQNTPDRIRERMLPFYRAWLAPRALSIPVIAAVNGPAIGAGLCAALACDLRYGSPAALFSAPFVALGTHAGMGVMRLLPDAVGNTRAREMLYTGRAVGADEALSWGLINGVAEDVVAKAVDVATGIAASAPIAVRLTKSGFMQAEHGLEAALQWEGLAQPITMATDDLHEGILARRERRAPRFTGS